MKAEFPKDEPARLAVLGELGILDTQADLAFDALTRLASQVFGAPISVVSLVDAERQWFKSRVGVDATETHRDIAFCAHTIRADEPLVVNDARLDVRFRDNPAVLGLPNVVFYAGIPLHAPSRHRVGTLCVIDHKPRMPTDQQMSMLVDLGIQAEALLAFHASRNQLARRVADLDETHQLLAHDLKAPVSRIKGLLAVIASSDPEVGRQAIAFATAAVERLQTQLTGLFDYTAKRSAGAVSPVSLADAVAAAWDTLAPSQAILTTGELPVVPSHAVGVRTVMHNLLSNAVVHAGKPNVQVSVRADRDGSRWTIRVANDGIGVAPSEHKRMFALFGTVANPQATGSSGVGLAIVRRLVADAGGEVGVESDGVCGTTVWFTWPALPTDWTPDPST